jgi:Raf kinase inhibitor-like YbhB/YbcL family protein
LFLCAVGAFWAAAAPAATDGNKDAKPASLEVKTSAFKEGETIPKDHTKDGRDVSPALEWSEPPAGTKSFALVCNDPGVGRNGWSHWVIFNLPADARKIPEQVAKDEKLPDGSVQGKNGFGKVGYLGPAPPKNGPHHYHFTVYALDTMLDLKPGATRAQLLEAMKGHILAEGTRIGVYQR